MYMPQPGIEKEPKHQRIFSTYINPLSIQTGPIMATNFTNNSHLAAKNIKQSQRYGPTTQLPSLNIQPSPRNE